MKNFVELVRVRNLETGAIGHIARSLFENPKINNGILVEVDDTAKPYVPGMYKSKMPAPVEETEDEADDETPSEEDVTDA